MSSDVRACMTGDVLAVRPDDTLAEAAQVMVERSVGSAVVLEPGGVLAGIVTERDVLRAVARGRTPWTTSVRDCMTAGPVTIAADTPAVDALQRMISGGFRHLPVLDGDRVVGIVSMRDFVSVTVGSEDPTPASA